MLECDGAMVTHLGPDESIREATFLNLVPPEVDQSWPQVAQK